MDLLISNNMQISKTKLSIFGPKSIKETENGFSSSLIHRMMKKALC